MSHEQRCTRSVLRSGFVGLGTFLVRNVYVWVWTWVGRWCWCVRALMCVLMHVYVCSPTHACMHVYIHVWVSGVVLLCPCPLLLAEGSAFSASSQTCIALLSGLRPYACGRRPDPCSFQLLWPLWLWHPAAEAQACARALHYFAVYSRVPVHWS